MPIYSHSRVRIVISGPTIPACECEGYTRITTRNMAPHDTRDGICSTPHLLPGHCQQHRSTLTLQSVAHYIASELESKSENGRTINIKSNKWALI